MFWVWVANFGRPKSGFGGAAASGVRGFEDSRIRRGAALSQNINTKLLHRQIEAYDSGTFGYTSEECKSSVGSFGEAGR